MPQSPRAPTHPVVLSVPQKPGGTGSCNHRGDDNVQRDRLRQTCGAGWGYCSRHGLLGQAVGDRRRLFPGAIAWHGAMPGKSWLQPLGSSSGGSCVTAARNCTLSNLEPCSNSTLTQPRRVALSRRVPWRKTVNWDLLAGMWEDPQSTRNHHQSRGDPSPSYPSLDALHSFSPGTRSCCAALQVETSWESAFAVVRWTLSLV